MLLQDLRSGDVHVLPLLVRASIGPGLENPVQEGQIDRSVNGELETPLAQKLLQDGPDASRLPQPAEDQIRVDMLAAPGCQVAGPAAIDDADLLPEPPGSGG